MDGHMERFIKQGNTDYSIDSKPVNSSHSDQPQYNIMIMEEGLGLTVFLMSSKATMNPSKVSTKKSNEIMNIEVLDIHPKPPFITDTNNNDHIKEEAENKTIRPYLPPLLPSYSKIQTVLRSILPSLYTLQLLLVKN